MKIKHRKPRADALQNREEILQAARSVIQEFGIEVAFEKIAEKSCLGRATIYRNFADRQALLTAIYEMNLSELEQEADRIGKRDDAFFILLRYLYEMGIKHRHLGYFIRSADFPAQERKRLFDWFVQIFEAPIGFSKAAGLVKSDFSAKNISIIANMLGGAIDGIDPNDKRSFNLAFTMIVSFLSARN
jgi:AcrR family transcriptional regulator